MECLIKLFADFQNSDPKGRVRLNTIGTLNDLRDKGVVLKPGLKVLLDDDDELKTPGTIVFSNEENIWVAEIDWTLLSIYSKRYFHGN